jgi:hypothetical protein
MLINRTLLSKSAITIVLFVCMYLVFAILCQRVYLNDFPDWVYESVLIKKLMHGDEIAGYILKSYPVPNMLTRERVGCARWPVRLGRFVKNTDWNVCDRRRSERLSSQRGALH